TTPSPWQFSQAPFELKLNSDGLTLLTLAKVFRISSRIPVYVAGFDRLLAPTGDWSTTIASGCCGRNDWWISELFPDPATPVTTVSTPVGMSTRTFCRLLALASTIDSFPFAFRK